MTGTGRGQFPSTRWSIVLAAGHRDAPELAREALAALCEAYWYPLYAYVRRRGYDAEDARDLTQGFFARMLGKQAPLGANPELGRFRSYLLGAFKHYVANERDRERAQKRGGGQHLLRLDFETGERRYRLEPADDRTPETIYERRWALTLLSKVLDRLERESKRAGRAVHFDRMKPFLTGEGARGSYARLAEELLMTEDAIKVAVHRLRRRYRDLLRAEVAQTVEAPAEIEAELRHLFAAVSAPGSM